MNGRPPKPQALAALSGDRRRKGKGMDLPLAVPDVPDWLSEEAKTEWATVTHLLSTMRVVSEVDCIALAQLADYMAKWKRAAEQVSKIGMVIPIRDAAGTVTGFRRNPYVTMHLEYGLMVQRLLSQFGMTPSARARLMNGEAQATDNIFSRIASVQVSG
jgi:P27 family predicted phage terminase small subunit